MAQPTGYKRVWSIRLFSISTRVLAAVFAGLFLVGPGARGLAALPPMSRARASDVKAQSEHS